ncbi:alpha/beta fold hydrolase [Blastomonas aquatica]|uniref:alpha/beta fold hydrolase n=1 Tax=Blastomonas aquatica TaxID=1510276 RepID=UPI0036221B14
MTATAPSITTTRIRSFDGTQLAVHETGEGRALLLLHGLFSSAETNWIKFGHAAKLAQAGFRVIMPDLRAHGQSAAPHDPAAYPRDVLVDDALSLIETLGLDDFDLGGFSLGARTTAKLLGAGATPRKAILAGMGWEGLTGWGRRRDFFVTAIHRRDEVKRGDPHFMAVAFMKTQGIDPWRPGCCSTALAMSIPMRWWHAMSRCWWLCGADDSDNGSAPELARQLGNATYREIKGTHMSSVLEPSLAEEMVSFLTA